MLISVDHGNKQIKTVHTQPFTSGLIQGDTPGFGTDCLAYQGKYYTLTDQRIPYRRDKTEDERFFILTLFAIAYEIEAMGRYSDTLMRIQLAVGLPPAHFGVQAKRFINYFDGRGAISFQFRGKPYAVYIENTACFPQSFSAAVATVKNLTASPKVLVVDIGGFTADYVRLRNGVPDMSACDSLENGVILLYNRVRARANAELDVLLDESEIDCILRGEHRDVAPEVVQTLLKAEDLPFQLADLGLSLGSLVQIAFDLAPKLLGGGLRFEQLVRQVDGSEHGGVSAAHLGIVHDLGHFVADTASYLLHVGGSLVRYQGVFLSADGDDNTVCHLRILLFYVRPALGRNTQYYSIQYSTKAAGVPQKSWEIEKVYNSLTALLP